MNLKKLFALSVWMLLPCGLSLAEQLSGTLRGTVTDESGALIPGATVTVAGAVKKTVTTDQRGAFVFVGLTPGHYSVTVESTGFAQFQAVSVDISAGRTQTLNIPLLTHVWRQSERAHH